MEPAALPPRARDALTLLEAAVRAALERPSPHLRAIAAGSIPRGGDAYGTFHGGGLVPLPVVEPRFEHDPHDMLRLFRAVIGAAPGLRRVILHCDRPNEAASWTIRLKLVPNVEEEKIAKARQAIDKRVKLELAAALTGDARRVSFGRPAAAHTPELWRYGTENEQSEPGRALVELLAETDLLYRDAGHELTTAVWTLDRRKSLEFLYDFR